MNIKEYSQNIYTLSEDLIYEILDRFGTMPKEIENLLEVARIKMLARDVFVWKINQKHKISINYTKVTYIKYLFYRV